MACRILTSSGTFLGNAGSGAQAIRRLRSSQSFLPFPSRASLFWARQNNSKHRPIVFLPNNRHLQQGNVFSTSISRNVERKDGEKTEVGKSILAPYSTDSQFLSCGTKDTSSISLRMSVCIGVTLYSICGVHCVLNTAKLCVYTSRMSTHGLVIT